jgi:hypothetical protein
MHHESRSRMHPQATAPTTGSSGDPKVTERRSRATYGLAPGVQFARVRPWLREEGRHCKAT